MGALREEPALPRRGGAGSGAIGHPLLSWFNLVGRGVIDGRQVPFPVDVPAKGILYGVEAADALLPAHPIERS